MGIFDGSSKQIEYLDEERKKLWNRVLIIEKTQSEIQKQLTKNASESQNEAAQHSKKASEFKNKTENRLGEASLLIKEIKDQLLIANKTVDDLEKTKTNSHEHEKSIESTVNSINNLEADIKVQFIELNKRINNINEFILKYPNLDVKLNDISSFIAEIEQNLEKSGISLSSINKRKKEIDDLHREIFGYIQNDANEDTKVEGLKYELEKSYTELSNQLSKSLEEVDSLRNDYQTKFIDFEKEHTIKYQSINSEIRSLLPNALTAGLSSAFSEKKIMKKNFQKNYRKTLTMEFIL
ncbi:hypothetical protein BWI93_10570 [Siphonobacter sp. BAB-5385]|uniref:hypothetical protein n=1 Tax=Siphonobacter sp. BAB-5385 TaxID=1864822 RepID=UPI000B9E026D|nr:hypothetical protein [Siphonobacter sp. BAB-5385]OZI08189.1 hypothetical protein BWI93_10570 [Siphonobacter sp. BAB-5385]